MQKKPTKVWKFKAKFYWSWAGRSGAHCEDCHKS